MIYDYSATGEVTLALSRSELSQLFMSAVPTGEDVRLGGAEDEYAAANMAYFAPLDRYIAITPAVDASSASADDHELRIRLSREDILRLMMGLNEDSVAQLSIVGDGGRLRVEVIAERDGYRAACQVPVRRLLRAAFE